jgi:pimeloyl-ACP methyl ester carboxylesterase
MEITAFGRTSPFSTDDKVIGKRSAQMAKIAYRRITVGDLEIFYREAGRPDAPTILVLHGFPTASQMFRDLMPRLADRFRLIAPDLPGFGQSAISTDCRFEYTFENLARTMRSFTAALRLERFAIYVFDYGAPIGLRMALGHPECITAIISQNGNAYDEGLSAGWDSMKDYWSHPTAEYRER